jgi:hypothetical protein
MSNHLNINFIKKIGKKKINFQEHEEQQHHHHHTREHHHQERSPSNKPKNIFDLNQTTQI